MATETHTNTTRDKDDKRPVGRILPKDGHMAATGARVRVRACKEGPVMARVKLKDHDIIMSIAKASSEVVVQNVRSGFSAHQVKAFLSHYDLPQTEFADSVGLNPRTLNRRFKAGDEAFVGEDAAKVIRYAKVFQHAVEVFRKAELAKEWLRTSNPTLPGGEAPASLLDTEFGAEEVMESLVRIRHGIFA